MRKSASGPQGIQRQTSKYGFCLAKKRDGSKCRLTAGFGTDHLGTGRCKYHGGSTPTHIKAAAKDEMRKLLGKELEINPLDAILWCIRLRAGEIKWLSDRMASLDEKAWVEETMVGKQFHLYARERQHAMNDLARFSQMAISLGIAERAVKLAETYGHMIGRLIKGLLDDLELTEEQQMKAPMIVRRHLIAIEGGAEPVSVDRKALPRASGE